MANVPDWELHRLVYPNDLCEPMELLNFTHSKEYTESFLRLGLTDDEQRQVEVGIMMAPTLPPVIGGTGGIREFQFSTPKNTPGSLHLTAFYAYFPEGESAVLIDLMLTDEVGIITAVEREQLKALFEEIQKYPDG